MPRFPEHAPSLAAMKGSIYSAFAPRLRTFEGETYPLHIGDTWMEPARGCRMQDFTVADHPGMHRYTTVHGHVGLLEATAARVASRTGIRTTTDNVLITAGATGGLSACVGALLRPGDEVLILAPHWPLIAGIVRTFHGKPVQVPFIGDVFDRESAFACVREAISARTVAVYVNTPNNPTGTVLPVDQLEGVVEAARAADLWLLSDEVYEDYVYQGSHTYLRTLAPERTLSAYSFSKAFGMTGNRVGYVVGPEDTVAAARKVSTHLYYSTPTASQLAAVAALEGPGDAWVSRARRLYADMGARAAARLGVPAPQGSTFLFVDVSEHLDDSGLTGFLERCVARGLLVAPGTSFGPYPNHIRVCFTSAEPDRGDRGFEELAKLLGR